jgi:hypothetical protein
MTSKFFNLPLGTKPFCLGALAGAVLAVWIGFDALGWRTSGTAEALSKRNAEASVAAAFASVCSERFKSGSEYSAQLAALAKADRYSRGDVVAKGGWATMPGSKDPHPGVAQLCADLLIPEKT